MKKFVKKSVEELSPYTLEHTEAPIKLDAMENPFSFSKDLSGKILKKIEKLQINRYPDPNCSHLKKIYSKVLRVKPENLVIGNGSDELIQIILTAAGNPSDKILYPVPTFSMYGIIAKPLNLNTVEVPLTDNWQLNLSEMVKLIKKKKPAVVFISNPNNPTGNLFNEDDIKKIIEEAPGLVVVDEAYYNFSKSTFLPLINKYPNLIILRTLSKIGLAGLRVGMMVANTSLCAQIGKVRLPYNSNSLSQAAAEVALENVSEINDQIEKIIELREKLFKQLQSMEGVTPYPSSTNFILFKTENDSQKIFKGLLKEGILIRAFGGEGRLKNHLRVTIGKKSENDAFIKNLARFV